MNKKGKSVHQICTLLHFPLSPLQKPYVCSEIESQSWKQTN